MFLEQSCGGTRWARATETTHHDSPLRPVLFDEGEREEIRIKDAGAPRLLPRRATMSHTRFLEGKDTRLVLNASVWSGFSKHLDFVGEDESRASVVESNKVHMAAKIVDLLEEFDRLGKTYSSLVIPHLFQQAAVFAFWGDGGGGNRGIHILPR